MCARGHARPKTSLENRQAVNKSTAKWMPLFLAGIVGYVTWVVIVLVGVHYLLHPGPGTNVSARQGPAIAIIVLYFVIFFPFAVTYIRLFYIVHTNPGYVPEGQLNPPGTRTRFEEEPQTSISHSCTRTTVAQDQSSRPNNSKGGPEKPSRPPVGQTLTILEREAISKGEMLPPPGLEYYYSKEVFQCDPNGLPIWCSVCRNWKPDRSHHCSDVGRCVMKLDHFCPWVGGVVSENNFKFFVQFNAYAVLYTFSVLVVMAYYVAETKRTADTMINVHWVVVLALAGLFFLFTGGMVGKSIQDTLQNHTTIDAIDYKLKTMFLAIHVDTVMRSVEPLRDPQDNHAWTQANDSQDRVLPPKHSRSQTRPWHGSITYPLYTNPDITSDSQEPQPVSPRRTFAIIETMPGMNPWNLGPYKNFRQVMGNRWYDWILPVRLSPCTNHDRGDSIYELGSAIDRLKWDAGIASHANSETGHRRRRRRKQRRASHDSNESVGSTLATVNGLSGSETRHRQYSLGDGTGGSGV